jgi:hypothetical protein
MFYRRLLMVFLVLSTVFVGFNVRQTFSASSVILHGNVLPFLGQAQALAASSGQAMLTLAVGLSMRDRAGLDAYIQQLHDRKSPYFHQWLTPQQIADRFGPSQANYDAVVSWLNAQGISVTQTFNHRLVIMASTTADMASQVFGVNFGTFNYDNQTFAAATNEPSLPSQFSGVIQSVTGLDTYQGMKRHHAQGNAPLEQAGPDSLSTPYTPTNIQKAYNLPVLDGFTGRNAYDLGVANGPVVMGVLSPCEASTTDLNGFASAYGLTSYSVGSNYFRVAVNSKGDGSDPPTDAEPTLDLEWSHAMAPGATLYFYYDNNVGGCGSKPLWAFSGFIAAAAKVLSDNLVETWSLSWGAYETKWSLALRSSMDNNLASMVAAGMTGFVASGDCGAYDNCDRTNLWVDYPGSDPNVVDVGGTTLTINNDGTYGSESGLWCPGCASGGQDWGGGGGNSAVWPKPSWQSGVSGITGSNRGVPDVALDMDFHYPIYYGGSLYCTGALVCYGGTSFAAPEWNGIMATIIDAALYGTQGYSQSATQPYYRFGNVNFNIYTSSEVASLWTPAVRDVTTGANGYASNCGGSGQPTCGYSAGPGWDYATGWGSLVGRLYAYLVGEYPNPLYTVAAVGSANGWVNTFDAAFSSTGSYNFQYHWYGSAVTSVGLSYPLHPSAGSNVEVLAVGSNNGWLNVHNDLRLGYDTMTPSWWFDACGNVSPCNVNVAVSTDGSTIVVGGQTGWVNILDVSGSLLAYYYVGSPVTAVAINGDGSEIVMGTNNGWINKYHRSGSSIILDWWFYIGGSITAIAVPNNGAKALAVGSTNGWVNFWTDTSTSSTPSWWWYAGAAINSIACSGACWGLAVGSQNGWLNFWNGAGSPPSNPSSTWYRYLGAAVTSVAVNWDSGAPGGAHQVIAAGSANGWVNAFKSDGTQIWYAYVGGGSPVVSFGHYTTYTLMVGSGNFASCFFYLSGTPRWYFYTGAQVTAAVPAGM